MCDMFFLKGSSSVISRNRFECCQTESNINACLLWDRVVLVSFQSLDVGTRLWPKEINMIGQIASTGSLFPLLYDLSLSTANFGSSHRTPDCINILYRTHKEGYRGDVVYHTAQTPPC